MTDREMLELAAKAGGLDVWIDENGTPWIDGDKKIWNPLRSDGDALRLAVKLCLSVRVGALDHCVIVECENDASIYILENLHGNDCESARLAIVRAAAEIGKEMHQEVNSALLEDNYYKDMADAFYRGGE